MRRTVLAVLLLAGVLVVPARAEGPGDGTCTDATPEVHPYHVRQRYSGQVAFPASPPRALVVFFHGYGHTARDWAVHHLDRVASTEGVVAVAMDYPDGGDPARTWQVQEGADASAAAARELAARCGTDLVVAYGVSMGANAAGLAIADNPGLFDHWVAVEGAHNVVETYLEARAVSQVVPDPYIVGAARGIELEMGGSIEEQPAAYVEHSNVGRAADILLAGLESVVFVHGVGDGLVPYDQSREMATLLAPLRTEFTTVLTRNDCEEENAGTTVDEHITTPLGQDEAVPSPFAGHANENSTTHLVGRTGFERLHALLEGELLVGERVVDGHLERSEPVVCVL